MLGGDLFVGALGGTLGTLLLLVNLVLVIAALISIFNREDTDVTGNSRVLWALVVLLLPFGWLGYFVLARRPM